MPTFKTLSLPSKIPYAKPLLGVVFLLVAAAFVAPMFVDKERLKTTVVEALSKTTGFNVKANVQGSISPFPSPHLQLADVSITHTQTGKTLLSARQARLNLGWAGLFSAPDMPDMVLINPTINVAQTALTSGDMQGMAKNICAAQGTLRLEHGDINLQQSESTEWVRIQDVNGQLRCDTGGLSLSLHGKLQDQAATVDIHSALAPGGALTVAMTGDSGNRVDFSGTLPAAGATSEGTLTLHIGGMSTLMPADGTPAANTPPETALLDVKGDATLGMGELWLHRADATINGAKGTVAAYAAMKTLPTLAVEMDADTFNLHTFSPLLTGILNRSAKATAEASETIKEDRALVLLAHAKALTLGDRTLKNAQFNMEYGGLDVLLHDVSATTEDGSLFAFNGRYTDRTLGARIEGKASLEGNSFKGFLAPFEQAAANLPDEDFGAYSLAGNVFWSSEQFRVSEADVKLGDINFTGGLSTYFEKVTRSEAEIRMKNVNLDYFRNAWRKSRTGTEGGARQAALSGGEFQWLKRLTSVVDLNLWLDGFTFLDRSGERGNVHIIAKPAELSLSGVELLLPEGKLTGMATLNVAGERPKLTLVVAAPFFDSAYTNVDGDAPTTPWIDPTQKDAHFSEKLFDFSWAAALDSDFDINIASLTWDGSDYGFFKTKGSLKNQQIQLQNFGFNIFGGQLSANGTLTGGKVPALSASFALYNTHIEDLLAHFALPAAITGRANISGTVTTSGLHFAEWLKQADMRMAVTARGVHVPNFNLQGVLDVTQAARKTEDVVKGVAQMMASGSTDLSVDGNLNLAQGVVKTPGLTLAATTQTTGLLGGQMELLPWKMSLDAKFQFPQLSSVTVPTFGINIAGPMDAYTIRTDTASLEAYVGKRIVGE